MTSVLALDQGTTGSTALVVADDGRVLGRGYREITQHYPRPGWVEHDPEEIWRQTLEAAREAVRSVGGPPAAIGITNQRETVVVWERATGRPLHRALVWQDRRTADRCRALQAEHGDAMIGERTGLVWDPYFSATKIEWLLREVVGLRARAERGEVVFGTIDAWLIHRLTGGDAFVTDHTNASRTLLYDLTAKGWNADLLDLFGVPPAALPAIKPSSGEVGVARKEHFGVPIPVCGIAGDQQAALWGQGCWEPGQAKCTYGTGAFLLMFVGPGPHTSAGRARESRGLLRTVACDAAGAPALALEGSVFIAGAAVQWLRDGLGLIARADETDVLARSVADTGGVYFVPAFVGLGAPHWESEARGTIVGLTRGTGRAHLVRAALEAMAYSTREVVEQMVAESAVPLADLRVDGGAAANNWLMQFQADVLGVQVARPDVVETTALGAAGLAGVAAGVWAAASDFAAGRRYEAFSPGAEPEGAYRGWHRAVDTALYWAKSGFRPEGTLRI
ncbi:MAG: glycerol kinase GlpK [Gemmatimonadetes bacterium]|nr:glycerol kinase GlpK [Gemmatimonadota bacterium]